MRGGLADAATKRALVEQDWQRCTEDFSEGIKTMPTDACRTSRDANSPVIPGQRVALDPEPMNTGLEGQNRLTHSREPRRISPNLEI
jgi:hypothetical protein